MDSPLLSLKKPAIKTWLGILLITFLTAGCSFLEKSGAWVEPEVKVTKSHLVGLTLSKALLEVELEVHNPNRYPIVMGALDFQLDLQGSKIISGQQPQGNNLAAGEKQQLVLPLEIEFAELSQFISNLSELNALTYSVAGGMTFNIPVVGPLRAPYQVKGSLPLPRVPKFNLVGIEQKKLSFTGVDLLISLEVDTPNSFDFLVNQLRYSLTLNGHSVTSGGLTESLNLPAADKSKVEIPVSLVFNTASVGAFYNIFRKGGDLTYQLDLNSELGSSLPVLSRFPFNTKREGKVKLGH